MDNEKLPTSFEPKQMLVLRKDQKVRKGKHVSQGAHGAVKGILQLGSRVVHDGVPGVFIPTGGPETLLSQWIDGQHKKICVSVNSEVELYAGHEKALALGINSVLIIDSGLTEFNLVPTPTAVALGPDAPALLDQVTGLLQPL